MNNYPIFDILKRARNQLQTSNDEASSRLVSDIQTLIDADPLRSVIGFDPDTEVAIIWSVEDVTEVCPNLTPEQAIKVLRLVKKHHNACEGVNWGVIKRWAELYFRT